MKISKFFWFIRALIYRFTFGSVGSFSYIGKPLGILNRKNIFLGKKVRIYSNLRAETYDSGKITINDDVSIGQNFHITSSKYNLEIGSGTLISGNVFITNIDHNYENINLSPIYQGFITKKTKIGENCFIGFGAGIQAGTIIGNHCIIGANSVVKGVFPDYSVIVGSPAKIVKQYSFKTEKWEKYEG